jgi:hypothetical protein
MTSPSTDVSTKLALCCYVNTTPRIQVARIVDIENWYFERVVFPGQRLMFEAPWMAHLEIHTGAMADLVDSIECESLRVKGTGSRSM